jgi:tRNA A37 threonylcarbamoyltransferase TsaD
LVFSASGGHSLSALIPKNNFEFQRISEAKGIEENLKSNPSFLGIGALFSDLVCYLGLKNSKERIKGDGPLISRLAKRGRCGRFNLVSAEADRKHNIDLDCIEIKRNVLRIIAKEKKEKGFLSRAFISDMAASFESSVVRAIINYLCFTAKKLNVKEIHLVGGVAANTILRKKLKEKTKPLKIIGRCPLKKSYCTDNAAMIANLGYYKFKQNPKKYLKKRYLNVKSDLVLENLATRQFLELNKKLD